MATVMRNDAVKAAHRAMWALGDYHAFATATVWSLGPRLVDACGIRRGQRVLDVAAGTGNVAIRAAMAGADVTASDLTPEHFDAGRRAAREAGVALDWIEADAEALPFDTASFDVVTSCCGAMFAPDHQRVANEIARVCRPGGTIGLISFTPEGHGGAFFRALAPYVPPLPPGATPPVMWGDESHVRALLGGAVDTLEMTREAYVERAADADAYVELFTRAFGPMVAVRAALEHDPTRLAALDRDFRAFIDAANSADGGRIEIAYEYLLVVARR